MLIKRMHFYALVPQRELDTQLQDLHSATLLLPYEYNISAADGFGGLYSKPVSDTVRMDCF